MQSVSKRTVEGTLSATEELSSVSMLENSSVQTACYRTVECRESTNQELSSDCLLKDSTVQTV